jgi:hypothetical protein
MADVVLSDQVREAVENGEAVYTHDEVMAKLGFS